MGNCICGIRMFFSLWNVHLLYAFHTQISYHPIVRFPKSLSYCELKEKIVQRLIRIRIREKRTKKAWDHTLLEKFQFSVEKDDFSRATRFVLSLSLSFQLYIINKFQYRVSL